MKVALICIAKNEDNYINEWIQYHFLIGIDDIFIYQNDWRYNNSIKNNHLHLIKWDGKIQQIKAYNNFIQTQYKNFDFGIFIDVDEFICLNKDLNIKDTLKNYLDIDGIGVNWKHFGTSFLEFNNIYHVLTRFTYTEKLFNRHIKTILNFNRVKNTVNFCNPHYIQQENKIMNLEKTKYINGPFNYDDLDKPRIMQINHYKKTKDEFYKRRENGYPDQIVTPEKYKQLFEFWDRLVIKFNEGQDFSIINYLKKLNKYDEFNNMP